MSNIPAWANHRVSKNILLGELLPPDAENFGFPLDLVSPWIIRVSQALRDEFGPIEINTWIYGGSYVARGVRLSGGVSNINSAGSRSRHKYSMALDCKFKNFTAEQVRQKIYQNEDYWLSIGIVRIEKDTSWLHVDAGLSIYKFNP